MNNTNVAHLWAAQSRNAARGSNFYFEGPVIYSYGPHFPIAHMMPEGVYANVGAAPGPFRTMHVCLFTTDTYSNATAKHLNYARHAIPDNVYIFNVPDVLAEEADAHARNVADMLTRRDAAIVKASRARSNAAWLLDVAETLAHGARVYAQTFNLPAPVIEPVTPALLAEAKAKADKASKERAKESAARKAERAERTRLESLDYAAKEAAWLSGAAVTLPYRAGAVTLLRVKGGMIETSRGASVPVSVAPGLWQAACNCRRKGEALQSVSTERGSGFASVGDFTLREIRADGGLVVGCHVLEFSELARIAPTFGLPEYKEA
jgi:enoyl-CoA hydratase/carnithine racemase